MDSMGCYFSTISNNDEIRNIKNGQKLINRVTTNFYTGLLQFSTFQNGQNLINRVNFVEITFNFL